MRLPFPERIPLTPAFLAAIVLVGLQQLQQTALMYSVYCFLFLIIATVTFNLAGGFSRPSGSYVFFYSVLGVIIGLIYKAYLGEPADSHLRSPMLTIKVFVGGIIGMLIAVVISRKLSRKRPLLRNFLAPKDYKNAAMGCFAFGLLLNVLSITTKHENGSVLSAIMQLNRFLQMSIIIGTLHVLRKTGGRNAFSPLVIIYIIVTAASGVIFFSKEGMITPMLCWLVAAASLRYNLRFYQTAAIALATFITFYYLVPYSQYGRNQVPEGATLTERIAISYNMLADLSSVRELYLQNSSGEDTGDAQGMSYYNQPQGFFDRLTMIGPDDALIDYTQDSNFAGLDVIPAYFANWIPHFLWPNKPGLLSGNSFAHEIGGIVGEEDVTTGISFTPSAEAFHLAGWTGIFVVAPIIWTMLFVIFDSLCGDVRKSPWGLLVIALFAHIAPEGMLAAAIYVMWYGSVAIIFVAVATAYVMPLIGTLMVGPEQTGLVRLRGRGVPRKSVPPGPLVAAPRPR